MLKWYFVRLGTKFQKRRNPIPIVVDAHDTYFNIYTLINLCKPLDIF